MVSENRSTGQAAPRLTAAALLAASYECARRLRAGDVIDDPAKYVRIRAERLARDNASLYALLPDTDPIDFAVGLEPGLSGTVAPTTIAPRVIEGVTHRFITGTGWCPPLPRPEDVAEPSRPTLKAVPS